MEAATKPQRRTQAERREEAEGALLDAAVRLAARKGIEQTSLADICDEAGYSRGLINHHFGSKAALVERLAARAQEGFVASLPQVEDELEALLAVSDLYLQGIGESDPAVRTFFVMWGAAMAEETPLQPVFVSGDARFRKVISELIRSGQRAGTIRDDVDANAFALTFVGMLRGVGAQFFVAGKRVDVKAAKRLVEQILRSTLTPTSRTPKTRATA